MFGTSRVGSNFVVERSCDRNISTTVAEESSKGSVHGSTSLQKNLPTKDLCGEGTSQNRCLALIVRSDLSIPVFANCVFKSSSSSLILLFTIRFSCCVLLALSWNTTNENPSTDKLSREGNQLKLTTNTWQCERKVFHLQQLQRWSSGQEHLGRRPLSWRKTLLKSYLIFVHFWYTATLFRFVTSTPKGRKFVTE